MEYLLLFFLFGSVYSYAIYPLLLSLIPRKHIVSSPSQSEFRPSIDLIITAHNEQLRIREKIENALELDYPRDKLTILIASDGSTDETNAIVTRYEDANIRLIKVIDHLGKENAQRSAIESSNGDIIVFSDVATMMQPDALKNLTALFTDKQVGAVSSEDRFIAEGGEIAA